jgi:hypothetical protein
LGKAAGASLEFICFSHGKALRFFELFDKIGSCKAFFGKRKQKLINLVRKTRARDEKKDDVTIQVPHTRGRRSE